MPSPGTQALFDPARLKRNRRTQFLCRGRQEIATARRGIERDFFLYRQGKTEFEGTLAEACPKEAKVSKLSRA
jgi:hypothetical protein